MKYNFNQSPLIFYIHWKSLKNIPNLYKYMRNVSCQYWEVFNVHSNSLEDVEYRAFLIQEKSFLIPNVEASYISNIIESYGLNLSWGQKYE